MCNGNYAVHHKTLSYYFLNFSFVKVNLFIYSIFSVGAFKRKFKGILKKILSPSKVIYEVSFPPLVPCLSGEQYFSLPENIFNAWELKGFSHLWKLRL